MVILQNQKSKHLDYSMKSQKNRVNSCATKLNLVKKTLTKSLLLDLLIRTELDTNSFSRITKILMGMGPENAGMLMNSAVVATGLYTCGNVSRAVAL